MEDDNATKELEALAESKLLNEIKIELQNLFENLKKHNKLQLESNRVLVYYSGRNHRRTKNKRGKVKNIFP